jgi:hypothetical protein
VVRMSAARGFRVASPGRPRLSLGIAGYIWTQA